MRGAWVGNGQDDAAPSALNVLDELCKIYEYEYRCANMSVKCKSK